MAPDVRQDVAADDGPSPIESDLLPARELMQLHAPRPKDDNKRLLFRISCPPGAKHVGALRYSRWAQMPLPEWVRLADASAFEVHEAFYDYIAPGEPVPGATEWYVHFADPELFALYGTAVFVQDEWQVVEHPALAALKEARDARGIPMRTVERGRPTPILIAGAERRIRFVTNANAAEGRPDGLYGESFSRATEEAIRRATSVIDPPTITNLIAISAPRGGRGRYRSSEIELALSAAFTGFRAAVMESRRLRPESPSSAPVDIHTGSWGCGVFGGNPVMMTTVQSLAAVMAGATRIVFHVGDSSGRGPAEAARELLLHGLASGDTLGTAELIRKIESLGLEWGRSG
jgi:hypothetical protein